MKRTSPCRCSSRRYNVGAVNLAEEREMDKLILVVVVAFHMLVVCSVLS